MENHRKRVALLCGQPDEDFQRLFIEGVERIAFSRGFDVCVFAMYQKFQENKEREIGESTIFKLFNPDLFDTIIVMGDTIQTPGVLGKIDRELHDKAKVPVIFVDSESSYFPSINLHHYDAIVKLTEHLIEVHGYKDIAFVTGKKWHPHSKERLTAFIDTMKKHGLEIGPDRIFYGDFWYSSGLNIAETFVNENKKLPEAFACANDYMAIGLAEGFERHGIKVPDDVAIIGYDSVDVGRDSPSPVTSIPIPVEQFGAYAADTAIRLSEGLEVQKFTPDYEMFLGGSCGCHCESCVPKVMLRSSWKTLESSRSFYSTANRIIEDMYSKETFRGAMDSVRSYVYQIGEFEQFHLCVNSTWIKGAAGQKLDNYTDEIFEVVTCDRRGERRDRVNFDMSFPLKELLPALKDTDGEPRSFLFTPLHFDAGCFGYAVVSYGNKIRGTDLTYILWLRSIMLGMEALRRQDVLATTRRSMEENLNTDKLTGLANYGGFIEKSIEIIDIAALNGKYVTVIAVDISGIGQVNKAYGRKEGDKLILHFSELLPEAATEDGLVGRLGNDEFVIAAVSDDMSDKRAREILDKLSELVDGFNAKHDYSISYTYGISTKSVSYSDDMEQLINAAVSIKNGNKTRERTIRLSSTFTEEEKQTAEVVSDLLDTNKLDYHFQPIINACDGKVYAYEALMRPRVKPYIYPPVVIEYASRMGRLEDIERLTFLNVLKIVETNKEAFEGKKIFINSIPGIRVNDVDREEIFKMIDKFRGQIVIELTERTELDDTTLADMKTEYRKMGIETAVDDYGTGYSNIVNLLRYMPDYVKIDRMLLTGIEDNPQKRHFVREIVKFAREYDFKILAEGVETSAELETCIKLGADLIQGHYTAYPSENIVKEIDPRVSEEIFRYYSKTANYNSGF